MKYKNSQFPVTTARFNGTHHVLLHACSHRHDCPYDLVANDPGTGSFGYQFLAGRQYPFQNGFPQQPQTQPPASNAPAVNQLQQESWGTPQPRTGPQSLVMPPTSQSSSFQYGLPSEQHQPQTQSLPPASSAAAAKQEYQGTTRPGASSFTYSPSVNISSPGYCQRTEDNFYEFCGRSHIHNDDPISNKWCYDGRFPH